LSQKKGASPRSQSELPARISLVAPFFPACTLRCVEIAPVVAPQQFSACVVFSRQGYLPGHPITSGGRSGRPRHQLCSPAPSASSTAQSPWAISVGKPAAVIDPATKQRSRSPTPDMAL